jgi:hypothetical protein
MTAHDRIELDPRVMLALRYAADSLAHEEVGLSAAG